MTKPRSERISPTAHYIGWLKHRGGVSGTELATTTGRLIHGVVWPLTSVARVLGGVDVEQVIVARHRGLDHLLARAIEDGTVSQVIELAAGLSPRGLEFSQRYADRGLIYVEGDLPGMCARKREALAGCGPLQRNHHVVELDALLDSGPSSFAGVGARLLDPSRGTAVVCEGLTPYLDRSTMVRVWQVVARSLAGYRHGRFLSEVYFPADFELQPLFQTIVGLFSGLTRGSIHLDFDDIADVEGELERAGFAGRTVHRLGDLVREIGLPGDPNQMPVHMFDAVV